MTQREYERARASTGPTNFFVGEHAQHLVRRVSYVRLASTGPTNFFVGEKRGGYVRISFAVVASTGPTNFFVGEP